MGWASTTARCPRYRTCTGARFRPRSMVGPRPGSRISPRTRTTGARTTASLEPRRTRPSTAIRISRRPRTSGSTITPSASRG
jgi:hypothetical protein